MLKTTGKEKVLKGTRGKRYVMYRRTKIGMTADTFWKQCRWKVVEHLWKKTIPVNSEFYVQRKYLSKMKEK